MAWTEDRTTRRQRKRKQHNFWIFWRDDNGERLGYHAGDVTPEKAEHIRAGIDAGEYPDDFEQPGATVKVGGGETVRTVVQYWLDTYSKPRLRSHRDCVYRANRHIFPALGDVAVLALSNQQCQTFMSSLPKKKLEPGKGTGKRGQGDTLSITTANHVHKIMAQSLALAVELGVMPKNPMDGIKPFKVPESDAHIRYILRGPEVAKVYDIPKLSTRYTCIVALLTAMRRGEVFGLRWLDNDESGTYHVLHVRKSYGEPTKGSRLRKVPVVPELAQALREWKRMWPQQSGTGRLPTNEDLIFPVDGSGGRMRSKDSDYDIIEDIREATGREDVIMHDLRHTAATRMAQAGVNIFVIQKALGHSSIKTTEKYIHTEDDMMAREMAKLSGKPAKVLPMKGRTKGGQR